MGGAISWFVTSRSKDAEVNRSRGEKGTLIASGFIAGGALMGVVSAILKFAGVDWYLGSWNEAGAAGAAPAEMIAFVPFLGICAYMIFTSLKKTDSQ